MNQYYGDILKRIPEKPVWWDENAVPRYEPFTVCSLANIYAVRGALLEIRCQNCHAPFVVAMSQSELDIIKSKQTLEEAISDGTVHYGDPPNSRCCTIGPSMNSEPLRVLEFWAWDPDRPGQWIQYKELERDFPTDDE